MDPSPLFALASPIFLLECMEYVVDLLAEVPAYRALEDLHHEGEHRPCQRSIPAALGGLVADECVLGLYLQELRTCRA